MGMKGISLGDKLLNTLLRVIFFPLAFMQVVLEAIDKRKRGPAGRIVPIGKRSRALHAIVAGEGSPVIVLESGMGGGALDWSLVQPELAKLGTVVSYDRAGFGWSSDYSLTGRGRTCRHYAEDLRELLKELGLQPPFLLVGHSYGGMITRSFASLHANEVSGLVLVDAVHESRYVSEGQGADRRKQRGRYLRELRLGYLLSPIAIPRLLNKHIGSKRLPETAQRAVRALGFRAGAYRAAYAECLAAEASARELIEARPLRQELPVMVLSAGRQDEEWKASQRRLIGLTSQTKQVIVRDSWHSIQIHKPDAVIDAVKALLGVD